MEIKEVNNKLILKYLAAGEVFKFVNTENLVLKNYLWMVLNPYEGNYYILNLHLNTIERVWEDWDYLQVQRMKTKLLVGEEGCEF